MTTVPVQDLKQHLAHYLARVARGERLVITRRNQAVAELSPITTEGRTVGRAFGSGHLAPLSFRVPDAALTAVIAEDRAGDR